MSGRINYSNLSDSLKEKFNNAGLTEEQVNELIENALVDQVGELNGLMTEEKGDLVGAINELFQSANNGKQLIASAIGEPLSSEDTFSAMSNDINGLLSTFKTNMMNNGITVESNDKFKSLIDKIATMVEEGSGKGIQFASGSLDGFSLGDHNDYVDTHININFGFIPNFVFILKDLTTIRWVTTTKLIISNIREENMSIGNGTYWAQLVNVTENGVDIRSKTKHSTQSYGLASNCTNVQYYAIGVGEEDTTLRDSLASILQEEGVSVTEEDDMASLIAKVDSEFTKDNNEITNLTNELAGKVTPAGTAVAGDVLSGKTFINNTGQTITGTMAKMSTHTEVAEYVAWNENSIYLGIPTGAYVNTSSTGYPEVYIGKTRLDKNLVPENIVSGKSICGVAGTAIKATKVTASDNVLIEPMIEYGRSSCSISVCSLNPVQLQKICCTFTGSVRVKTTIQANNVRSGARLMAYFQIQRNGNVIYTSNTYTAIRETALEVVISLDLNDLQLGDYILFYGYTNGGGMDFTGWADPLTICGTIL